ncbi:uncharacterized protein PHALS_12289 [Plasmopara halstedii]|uniref:Uncharacterized protein n=1 Tax=Plasmopara halstedii TaxID=4781 RepID=A0A0P1ALV2_PLAHL|nr:uncharacterized protein PHALS_12289 [Plasmopara halstedii]CEG41982.1 hypothetical protein PHALS_12289 [Plasmopara halstedii]|eukprot:XP_024578351.1 hypothetical protein PHALS_12289 [Plasmopara halstedii]
MVLLTTASSAGVTSKKQIRIKKKAGLRALVLLFGSAEGSLAIKILQKTLQHALADR